MPGMNRLPALPACCTPLRADWPLPFALPGSVWLSTDFSPMQLAADDFARSAITMPASIQRSVAKRQAEFLAGRLCARAALLQLDGTCTAPDIGEDRAPVWPSHISGAITHSNGRAGALVALKSEWQGLGIDLEKLLNTERAQRLVKEVLTPDERLRMTAVPAEQIALRHTDTNSGIQPPNGRALSTPRKPTGPGTTVKPACSKLHTERGMCQAWVTTTTRLMPSGSRISALIWAFSQVVRLRSSYQRTVTPKSSFIDTAINSASLGGVP